MRTQRALKFGSLFFAAVAGTIYYHVALCCDAVPWGLALAGHFCVVTYALLLLMLRLADPGAIAGTPDASWQRCSVASCALLRPPGTHHCRKCNRCVSGRDHHCIILSICIGAGNHALFVAWLASASTSLACLATASVLELLSSQDRTLGYYLRIHKTLGMAGSSLGLGAFAVVHARRLACFQTTVRRSAAALDRCLAPFHALGDGGGATSATSATSSHEDSVFLAGRVSPLVIRLLGWGERAWSSSLFCRLLCFGAAIAAELAYAAHAFAWRHAVVWRWYAAALVLCSALSAWLVMRLTTRRRATRMHSATGLLAPTECNESDAGSDTPLTSTEEVAWCKACKASKGREWSHHCGLLCVCVNADTRAEYVALNALGVVGSTAQTIHALAVLARRLAAGMWPSMALAGAHRGDPSLLVAWLLAMNLLGVTVTCALMLLQQALAVARYSNRI